MKKYITDYEKLSAYIDGELPLSDKNEFEEKLSLSPELQKQLKELKKIKELTAGSFPPLGESPYFDTRVMANLKSDSKIPFLRSKWVPVLSVTVVTLILMIVIKFNPQLINRLVEEQTTNLAAFYKENLKPILYAADLSNEDIFNFAFYKELPLDNTKEQYLQIGNDSAGVEYFEIRKSSYNIQENNYERFVTALNLDEAQKQHVDSILEHYASELQAQVLVNDRNTVAINPNLWNYNRAIAADLVKFASQINEPELRKVIPMTDKYIYSNAMEEMVVRVKSNNENNYIFLTPDTIFTSWIDVDSKEMKEELRKAREELKHSSREIAIQNKELRKNIYSVKIDSLKFNKNKKYRNEKFDVFVGDNNFRIEIPDFEVPEIPDMDSISAHVDKVLRAVHVYTTSSPNNPTKLSKRYNFQYSYNDSLRRLAVPQGKVIDSLMNFNYNYLHDNNKRIDSLVSLYIPHIRMKQDSLTTYFKMYSDSGSSENNIQDQLKDIEIEMRRFREEMENLRKELNRDTNKVQIKKSLRKPVEI
jgi:hypothetical protein